MRNLDSPKLFWIFDDAVANLRETSDFLKVFG